MKRRGTPIDGILLLNKPIGVSSNGALQRVKRLLGAQKAGHTGSLDPYASGMLPICFGEATKFSQFFLDADKSYDVVMRLGAVSTTGDQEGEIVAQMPVPDLTEADLEAVFSKFTGAVQQIPSMYSAIKYQGKPLYELARKGKSVEREARTIHINGIRLKGVTGGCDVAFEVDCSKGTYIRTLVEDMGQFLGCGAYVLALHRLHVAPFQDKPMWDFEALGALDKLKRRESCLALPDTLSTFFPKEYVPDEAGALLRRGMAVSCSPSEVSGRVVLVSESGHFLGLGERTLAGTLHPKRLIAGEC